jgi:hypothetical protein
MTERPLPDDPADWPDDPNKLLGVSFGVSPRELRRAYHRLIRIYKPEQLPEQFRRIREAYEHLLRIAEMFGHRDEPAESPPVDEPRLPPAPKEPEYEDHEPQWTAANPQPVEETTQEKTMPSRPLHLDEELEELWSAAIGGSPAPAYERLAQLTQQYAGRAELYLRLYWLLVLWPDLDARRVPADWLVQGLRDTGLSGPLRELYREQVADIPAEALSERYEQLLSDSVPPALLADLIDWRIQAAARLGRLDVLEADLSKLQRFDIGEEQLWLRLLFSLADHAAWAGLEEKMQLLSACRREIARHEHLASGLGHLFDRFDLLVEAAEGWLRLWLQAHVPPPFLRLLAASWTRPFAETRAALMEILDWIAQSPGVWLDHFDEVKKHAPALLALFGELLDRFEAAERRESEQRVPDLLRELFHSCKELFHSCIASHHADEYQERRHPLLLFCIREHIAPEEIAEAAGGEWEKALLADWPLRYVCRAYRLFWA